MPPDALSLAAVGWSIAGTGIVITAGLNDNGILLQLEANNLRQAEEGRATRVMRFIPEITHVQMRVDDLMQWAKQHNLQLSPISPIDQEYARLAGSYEGFKTL